MPTIPYKLKNGKRVPGVTTIIGRFKECGGLMHWANQMGLQGKDHREVAGKEATAGNICHSMIEEHVHGREWEPPDKVDGSLLEKANQGFAAYMTWESQISIEITQTEMNLVSEEYRFGGCPDAVGRVDGATTLFDWKTGKLYPDHLLQVAAYRHLVNDCTTWCVKDVHILRIGKEFADFTHKYVTSDMLDVCWEQFKLLREAYDRDKIIKKMAG